MECQSPLDYRLRLKLYYGYLYSKEPKTATDIMFMQELEKMIDAGGEQAKPTCPKHVLEALVRVINFEP